MTTSKERAPGPGWRELPGILRDPLAAMQTFAREYGSVVRVPIGPRVNHLVTSPELFKYVLVENHANFSKGRTFEKTRGYLGNGIATSAGAHWRRQRRLMQPHFHREQIRKIGDLMTATIDETAIRWQERAVRGETFDVWPDMMSLALQVTTRALFGTILGEDAKPIVESFQVALEHTMRRVLSPIEIPDWLPLPRNLRFHQAMERLDAIVYRLIEVQRGRLDDASLLAMLAGARDEETGEQMSDTQLRDEILTLMLGGHETSGNALAWTWYLLSRNPEADARMREEIQALGGKPPGMEDLGRLSYTSWVFEEALRLYPQNWVMSRDTIEEDTLAGFAVPPKTTVFLGVYVCHHSPEHWTDPEKFEPLRFSPEQEKGRHPFAYIPFGGGQRKCIGASFASMEATLVLARLAQRFHVEVPPGVTVRTRPSFALRPRDGVPVRLRAL